jgi:hypothetical protein
MGGNNKKVTSHLSSHVGLQELAPRCEMDFAIDGSCGEEQIDGSPSRSLGSKIDRLPRFHRACPSTSLDEFPVAIQLE